MVPHYLSLILKNHRLNSSLCLRDVIVVPHITKNLLSISKITRDLPVTILFDNV